MPCDVSKEQLWSWIDRGAAELEPHLAECPQCRALADEYGTGIKALAAGCGADSVPLPEKIGAYAVTGLLGEGGQALVYRAEQESPRRPVAVKVLKGGRFVGGPDIRHFRREIEALGTLSHPAIATIFEAGRTAEGHHFFVMELIDGLSLDEYVREHSLPLRQRLELFCKVCAGVQYAHEHGVVHRDLKPSNILVTPAGDPKILDFGLVRLTEADVTLTQTAIETGEIAGTLGYMSPEQTRGNPQEVDQRSDVYSLGVILYELLTERPPYDLSGVILAAVRTICETPPRRPSTLNRVLRGDLETIVLKALEKESERRCASAAELAEDVRRYLSGEPVLARLPSRLYRLRKRLAKRRVWIAAGAAVVVLGLVGVRVAQRQRERELTEAWHAAQSRAQRERKLTAAQREAELKVRRENELIQGRREVAGCKDLLEGGNTQGAHEWALHLAEKYPELRETALMVAQAQFTINTGGTRATAIDQLRKEFERDPTRWYCAALLAEMYETTEAWDKVTEWKPRAEHDAPDAAEAWYLESFATLNKSKALRCARQAVQCDPTHQLALERWARLCLRTNNLREALEAARRLLEAGADRYDWTRFRALIFVRLDQFQDALQEYDALVQQSSGSRKLAATFERAHVYRRLGRWDDTVKGYKEAFAGTEHAALTPWKRRQIVTPLWILGSVQEAIDTCGPMLDTLGSDSYDAARLYIMLRDEGEQSDADRVLRGGLKTRDADPWRIQIFKCLAGKRSPDELIQSGRGDSNLEHLCEAYYYAGEVYRLKGELENALESFDNCLRTDVKQDIDNFPDPMNEYDLAEWRLGRLNGAAGVTSQP